MKHKLKKIVLALVMLIFIASNQVVLASDDISIILHATVNDSNVDLNWTIDGEFDQNIRLLKDWADDTMYPVIDGGRTISFSDVNQRSYTDDEVEKGVTYYYQVCLFDNSGYCTVYSNSQLVTIANDDAVVEFLDIHGHIYEASIDYVREKNIVNGYPDGTYKPDNAISRGEFSKILIISKFSLYDMFNCISDFAGSNTRYLFYDVWLGHDFAKYICVAKDKGIITGYDNGDFRPENEIEFIEAAKILVKVFDIPVTNEGGEWYEPYVYALQDKNYIPTTVIDLHQHITRGEMAEMIWRIKEDVTGNESSTLLP